MSGKRIGVLTGGGDCPGLNAVIRAIVKAATSQYGMEVVGFQDSYRGVVEGNVKELTYDAVSGILTRGGTILGTSNKDRLFGVSYGNPATDLTNPELKKAKEVVGKLGLSGLIVIGGDGTLTVASHLHQAGIPVIGVPKTIDNDVQYTDRTVGFDTACMIATEAIDRLHSTADSHHRAMVVEVMGRTAGWIALVSGIAGGGDIVLIPEIPYTVAGICKVVKHRYESGRRFSIIVVAEGACERGGSVVTNASSSKAHPTRLGGIAPLVAGQIEEATGIEARSVVLGHVQRGGTPTYADRVLASQYGHAAAGLAARGEFGQVVVLRAEKIEAAELLGIANKPRTVVMDSPLVQTARAVGMSFGE